MTKRLIDAQSTTGAGNAVSLGSFATGDHTMEMYFTVTGGSVTALTVALEGSLDGVNFYTLGSHSFNAGELTARRAITFITGKLVDYVRANITTLTNTGTAYVTVMHKHQPHY